MKKSKLLAAAVTVGALAATAVWAAPPHEIHFLYYSDASKTTVVGEGYLTCAPTTFIKSGKKTDFYDTWTEPCPWDG